MSQQINLFNPIFLKQKKYFSALTMLQALALILLGSILLLGYTTYALSSLSAEASTTAGQLDVTRAQLAKLNAIYGLKQKNKTLEDEIQKEESEVKSLQRVFDTLQKGEFGSREGYSEYLRAYSRQVVAGLWLTGFSIYGAGNEIELQGRALQPELVPAYINRLKRERVMQGKSFASLDMQVPQVETDVKDDAAGGKRRVPAGYVEFNLRSSGITQGAEVFPVPSAPLKESTPAQGNATRSDANRPIDSNAPPSGIKKAADLSGAPSK